MGISLLSLIGLIICIGLCYRITLPELSEPLGKMIDMGGYEMHIIQEGEKSDKPTVVIQAGAGLSTDFFHWLSEGLKDSLRVIRYDRIGLGKSDPLDAPRDPEAVARRLYELLKKAGESPPYLLIGHSIGGPQIRVFAELYPDEVQGLFFLDATHPDHVERYDAPKQTSFKYKAYLVSIELQAFLSDVGVMPLIDRLWGTPYYGQGLPDEANQRFKEAMRDGKAFRAFKEEMRNYYSTIARSGQVEDFGSLAIRAFYAVPEDPVERQRKREKLVEKINKYGKHKEYSEISSNAEGIEMPGNHVSIFTEQNNADFICEEVLEVVRELEY